MKQSHLAKRYARAFIDRIIGAPEPVAAVAELKMFSLLVSDNKRLRDFFHGPLFSASEKSAILQAVLDKVKLSSETARMLAMLLEQRRFHLLHEVVVYSGQILNERMNKTSATVFTAVAMPVEAAQRLEAALRDIAGRIVDIKTVVDPGLLGGIKVKLGSVIYDGSIKGQLENLREELMKG
ncbi:MAG: ATP synthase F1 subunit delta [Nitrospirae bacterium]|nr:ATP synthase F1 subunit delta [Nitrospirota bacterium]